MKPQTVKGVNMAERRMFAKKITDTDAFLDMPLSTQALYFHLSMHADDEGFVSNPKRILKMVSASDDDLKLLILKRFILTFDSGVVVIKHWKIHNYIQSDRFVPTTYVEERKTLVLDEKKAYIEKENAVDTKCIQNGYKLDTQYSIGKCNKVCNSDTSYYSPQTPQGEKEEEKPTKAEVITYFIETLHRTESEAVSFWTWNENRDWRVGSTPIRKWELFAEAWRGSETTATSALERTYSKDDLEAWKKDLQNFDNIEI